MLVSEMVKCLIQIVLFGQPELDTRLAQYNMRQLLQRISFSASLLPLNFAESVAYINHRLSSQGASPDLFDLKMKRRIWVASRGIPRLIHQLCHKAMLLSYAQGKKTIELSAIRSAIKDTPQAKQGYSLQNIMWR